MFRWVESCCLNNQSFLLGLWVGGDNLDFLIQSLIKGGAQVLIQSLKKFLNTGLHSK